MKKILLALLITLFSSSIFASDEKLGRFFEDQPDVTDDYQIHFIYFLAKKTKDNERDINGQIEKEVKKIDDLFFGKDSFKKFTDHFSNMNQELTVVKNSNIAFDLDTSEDLDLLTLEQRNKLFKDNDN